MINVPKEEKNNECLLSLSYRGYNFKTKVS